MNKSGRQIPNRYQCLAQHQCLALNCEIVLIILLLFKGKEWNINFMIVNLYRLTQDLIPPHKKEGWSWKMNINLLWYHNIPWQKFRTFLSGTLVLLTTDWKLTEISCYSNWPHVGNPWNRLETRIISYLSLEK
jgi:hypothetical protein